MAKQNTTVDAKTGEVLDNDGAALTTSKKRNEADSFDALAMLNKDLLARAEKVEKAKSDAFRKTEQDFWKPEKAGEELRGVYIDTKQGSKYKVHFIGRLDPSTKRPVAVRINGSTILTRELAKVDKGDMVRIVYNGESKTDEGNKLSLYEVTVLE